MPPKVPVYFLRLFFFSFGTHPLQSLYFQCFPPTESRRYLIFLPIYHPKNKENRNESERKRKKKPSVRVLCQRSRGAKGNTHSISCGNGGGVEVKEVGKDLPLIGAVCELFTLGNLRKLFRVVFLVFKILFLWIPLLFFKTQNKVISLIIFSAFSRFYSI